MNKKERERRERRERVFIEREDTEKANRLLDKVFNGEALPLITKKRKGK